MNNTETETKKLDHFTTVLVYKTQPQWNYKKENVL